MESMRPQDPIDSASTAELVRQALGDARELVRLEVRVAKQELRQELLRTKNALIAAAVALLLLLLALGALAVAAIAALGGTALDALLVAAALAVLGLGVCAVAYALVPKPPLDRARQRMQDDLDQLKEHVA